jgi:hypothetical protein
MCFRENPLSAAIMHSNASKLLREMESPIYNSNVKYIMLIGKSVKSTINPFKFQDQNLTHQNEDPLRLVEGQQKISDARELGRGLLGRGDVFWQVIGAGRNSLLQLQLRVESGASGFQRSRGLDQCQLLLRQHAGMDHECAVIRGGVGLYEAGEV